MHNLLIKNTYTDPRYLYLPTAAARLLVGVVILRAISSPLFRNVMARAIGGVLLLAIVFASGFKLRELNKKFADTGAIMRNFVEAMHKYGNLVTRDTQFCLLTFPYLPIDIDRNVWATAFLGDVISYVHDEASWGEDDVQFILFVDRDDQRNLNSTWLDIHSVIVDNVDVATTKIIPTLKSAEQIELAAIYDPSWRDPHPDARPLRDFGASAETKTARLEMGQSRNGTPAYSVKVTLKDSVRADADKLFFIYNQGNFELVAPPTGIIELFR